MLKQNRKSSSVYVRVDLLEDDKQWAAEARRLRRLLRESPQLAIALVRKRRRASRKWA
jgi:GrpB-like predicted nucleotidyltransferase (UPF0157 family)